MCVRESERERQREREGRERERGGGRGRVCVLVCEIMCVWISLFESVFSRRGISCEIESAASRGESITALITWSDHTGCGTPCVSLCVMCQNR